MKIAQFINRTIRRLLIVTAIITRGNNQSPKHIERLANTNLSINKNKRRKINNSINSEKIKRLFLYGEFKIAKWHFADHCKPNILWCSLKRKILQRKLKIFMGPERDETWEVYDRVLDLTLRMSFGRLAKLVHTRNKPPKLVFVGDSGGCVCFRVCMDYPLTFLLK